MKKKRQKWILPVVLAIIILCGGTLVMKGIRFKNVDNQTSKTLEDANLEETTNLEDKTLSEVKAASPHLPTNKARFHLFPQSCY